MTSHVSLTALLLLAALAVLAVLGYWNYSAWIVNANIERFVQSGRLDGDYLASTGPNGLPALVTSLPRLGAAGRAQLRLALCGDLGTPCRETAVAPESSWYEWNLRRFAARAASKELLHDLP